MACDLSALLPLLEVHAPTEGGSGPALRHSGARVEFFHFSLNRSLSLLHPVVEGERVSLLSHTRGGQDVLFAAGWGHSQLHGLEGSDARVQ